MDEECELKKEELDFRKKQEERALAQQNIMFQQQPKISRQFQDQLEINNRSSRWCVKCLCSNNNNKGMHYLNSWKRTLNSLSWFCCCFCLHFTKLDLHLCSLSLTYLTSKECYKNFGSLPLILKFLAIPTGIFTQPLIINAFQCPNIDESWDEVSLCISLLVLSL